VIQAAFVTLTVDDAITVILLADTQSHGTANPIDTSFPPVVLFGGDSGFGIPPIATGPVNEYGWPFAIEYGATGYSSLSLGVAKSGRATLGFVLLAASVSYGGNSGLLIDNVRQTRLQSVTEPGTLGLFAASLVGFALVRRRKGAVDEPRAA
jgi:hypothetical protein